MSTQWNKSKKTRSSSIKQEPGRHRIPTSADRTTKPSSNPDKRSIAFTEKSSFMAQTSSFPRPDPKNLPTSVRNLPPELRVAVRRNQNNASSKRGRERKRAAAEKMMAQQRENDDEIRRLEKRVLGLENQLRECKGPRREEVLIGKGEFFERRSFFGDPF